MPQQAVVAEDASNQRDRSGIVRTSLAQYIREGWQTPAERDGSDELARGGFRPMLRQTADPLLSE
jgi:predicted transcriptional regulator